MALSPPPLQLVAMAQNAEDVVLHRAFSNAGVRGGFYVDAGAGDPVAGSLTWNLIHRLGWYGIDIEPQARLADSLREANPGNVIVECALGAEDGELSFFRLNDNWGMSTLYPEVAGRHRAAGWDVEEISVVVRSLDSVLTEYADRPIDLLKIDVEGLESEVIAGANLSRWRPGVLVVEATAPASTTPTHHGWEGMVLGTSSVSWTV